MSKLTRGHNNDYDDENIRCYNEFCLQEKQSKYRKPPVGRGSAPNPDGELTALTKPRNW